MPPQVFPTVISTVQELEAVFKTINKKAKQTACVTSGDSMLPIIEHARVVTLLDYQPEEIVVVGEVVSFNVDGRQIIKKVESILPSTTDKGTLGTVYYLTGFNRFVSKDYKYFVPIGDAEANHFKRVLLYPYSKLTDDLVKQISQQ